MDKFKLDKFRFEQFLLIENQGLRLNRAGLNRCKPQPTRFGSSQASMAGKLSSQGLKGRIYGCLDTEIQIHGRRRNQGCRGWCQPKGRHRQHGWLQFHRLGCRVHPWTDCCRDVHPLGGHDSGWPLRRRG